MSKYRFKTEEEFKRDGLWNKNRPFKWVSVMNKYLGKDIPDKYNQACDKQEKFRYDQWYIEPHDYVLKEIQSEYTVGKWYGCKQWKSPVDFIKLERVYDDQAYFTECLNAGNYQKEGQNWWSFTTADPLFEADMSIVSPLLLDGHPDKIVAEESSFVLPSKWCIKVDRNCQPEEVYKWRKLSWSDTGYISYSKNWDHRVHSNHTEITFEQFKQHVLKESPVVETPKEENYVGITIKALVNHPEGTDLKKGEIIKIKEITYNNQFYTLEKTKAEAEGMVITRPINLSNWELVSESPKTIDMKDIQEEAKKRFPIGCKFIPVGDTQTYTLIEDDCTYEIRGEYIWAHDGHGHLYGDGKWATLVSLPETKKEMFYEGDYIVTLDVEGGDWNCARKNYCFKQRLDNKGIYPAIDLKGSTGNGHTVMSFDKKEYLKDWRYATPEEAAEYERIGKPYDVTTLQKKEAYDAQNTSKQLTVLDLVVGEIYIYDRTQISTYPEGPSMSIHGCNYTSNPKWMWCLSITHATEEQKALLRREIERNSKPEIMWPSDPIVEQRINTPSIKKETFIDNVQSVDVMLRTKRKSIKF